MVWSEERERVLTEFCREAVRTVSLSGCEGEMAALLASMMRKTRFDAVETDRYGNVVGRIAPGADGAKRKRLLLEGHMDHVDVADPSKWSHDPYGAEIADGRLYGRAASDMKGNLCAMLTAAAFAAEDGKIAPGGEVLVAGSVHEECFEGVASEEIVKNWEPDMVVIGEASNLTLKRGQRGRAEVVAETSGRSAHSSSPSAGVNAVKKMARFITALEERFRPATHPVLGEGILEVTDIVSEPYPGASTLPELCRATFDRRLLAGETEADVLDPLRRIADALAAEDGDFKARVFLAEGSAKCYTGEELSAVRFAPGWLLEDTHPFVAKALSGLASVGQEPALSHYSFCTNGSRYAALAGIPTIGYGASLETLAHVVDEYIELDQLRKACEGYYGIISAVLSRT